MTKPSYLLGWSAGSQVGDLMVGTGYFRGVYLDNGNSNYNHQDNHNHALAVVAGECHDQISFAALHAAYREARRGKKPSWDQLEFDATWLDQLFDLQSHLNAGTWAPGAPTCFIVSDPKHRQIHAPPFADRVVHHAVIPVLELEYEPTFIHDSYSNRRGKGTHAAVERLQRFMRQVQCGQNGGWYLQLDIANFFPSLHRPTLYRFLKARMERAGRPQWVRRAVHALLNNPVSRTGVRWAATRSQRDAVPSHKRLENAPPGCGVAIGNLSSQFFANVYLDPLDQFIKRTLGVKRYLRYVDDFVLVHESREQLEAWHREIEAFLLEELKLELKADVKLKPLTAGCDFLGYVIFPTHRVVRRRVIGHCRAKLHDWARQHVRGDRVMANPLQLEHLRSVCASYGGHFSHAQSWRLRRRLRRQFTWLDGIDIDGRLKG